MSRLLSLVLACTALPLAFSSAIPSPESTQVNRYTPGSLKDVLKDLKQDPTGALSVGTDGVLRSFAGNLEVIDYRQLDPDQVASFGQQQLSAWSALEEIPESVHALVREPIDGRLVTDETQLLNPQDKPVISPAETKWSSPDVILERQSTCAGANCSSLADCTSIGCNACFFPNGPPNGRCLDPV